MSEFTPGPWEALGPYPSVYVGIMIDAGSVNCDSPEPPTYEPVCAIHQGGDDYTTPPPEEALANARLIAQSPAMYEVIKKRRKVLRDWLNDGLPLQNWELNELAELDAIIAAVEGKS